MKSLELLSKVVRSALFKSTLFYALSSAMTSALPVLMMPILTRYMSQEEYGILGLFSMAITLLGALAGLSVHGAISRQYFERQTIDFPAYVFNGFLILTSSFFFLLTVLVIFHDQIHEFLPVSIGWSLVALLIAVGQFILTVRLVLWQMEEKAPAYFSAKVGQSILILFVTLSLVVGFGYGWRGYVGAQLVSSAVLGLFSLGSLIRKGFLKPILKKEYLTHALKFSVPLIPIELGAIALATLDSFIVSKILGVEKAGMYVAAVQIGAALILVTSAVNKAWVPWLFRNLKASDPVRNLRIIQLTYAYQVGLLLMAAVFSALSPLVVKVLLSEEYAGVTALIPYISFGVAFQGMYYMVCNYYYYHHKTHLLALVFGVTAVCNLVLLYLFVGRFGLAGAAMATMISYLICYVLSFLGCLKFSGMPWSLRAQ